jgi:hypothetical protein
MHHVEDESLNNIVEVLFARINPGLAFDPYLEFSFDSIKGGHFQNLLSPYPVMN